jgi:hypothetical protein
VSARNKPAAKAARRAEREAKRQIQQARRMALVGALLIVGLGRMWGWS